jgi:hypothetical protein
VNAVCLSVLGVGWLHMVMMQVWLSMMCTSDALAASHASALAWAVVAVLARRITPGVCIIADHQLILLLKADRYR